MPVEIEIKLRVPDLERARGAIMQLGYQIHHERTHEWNAVFDTRGSRLRGKGYLLRLRRFGNSAIVTFKGTSIEGRHKQREEIEFNVSDTENTALVFERLGFRPTFRYEKFRTEYAKPGVEGVITVDETPIGNFLELEGPGPWIDDTAGRLGYRESDYIKLSYGALYIEHCKSTGTARGDMLFPAKADV
jgi:adenylate cyclase class 2